MYAGQVVERAATRDLFARPRHPYTAGLLRSLPRMGQRAERLSEIPGMVPGLGHVFAGCRFVDRCDRAVDRCRVEPPPLEREDGRELRCFHPVP
jgi:peptide/nickel transport system ATP-binding protein